MLFMDFIDVIGHVKYLGKTSIISRVSSTHKNIIKMFSWVSQEKLALIRRRSRPYWVIRIPH